MRDAPIRFYFDFISPFGYFASLRIDALAARYGRQVEWHPMLLGVSVLKVMGIAPIVSLPLKGAYIVRDAQRYARRHGVALRRSAEQPGSSPLAAARAFAWARTVDAVRARHFASRVFHSYFVDCDDIADPGVVDRCLADADLSLQQHASARESGVAASLLRAAVADSLACGVFGSPFFIVDGEPFFGVEKLPLLEDWLDSGGW